MHQREAIAEVQTLESGELGRLLDRPYVPPQRTTGVIRHPSPPSRLEIVDYLIEKYGYCPPPELDIEYRSIFVNRDVPTSGKLYVDCYFQDCDFDIPTAPYAVIGSVENTGKLWWHAQRYKYATLKYNVIGVPNG